MMSTPTRMPGAVPMPPEVPRPTLFRTPWERQQDVLAKWLAGLAKPIENMVASDQMGPHVLEACHRAGIAVPDEAAAISVDNDETLCEGWPAAQVIARVPVSRSVLQRRFRQETGRSIQEEIIQARLRRARQLLAESDLPLFDVAERAGFKHQEYLGAIFKAHLGKMPFESRREFLRSGLYRRKR